MASTGEWELVVKGTKKTKNLSIPNGKLNKLEKQDFIDKAPKIGITGLVSSGISNSSGKENRQPKSPKTNATASNNEQKKKITEKKKPSGFQQPRTIEEALNRLNSSEMKNLLDVVVVRFHDQPLIWLKDLAAYLNVRLTSAQPPDPAFRGCSLSFPTSLLAIEVKEMMLGTISNCSDNVLTSFHHHCVMSMVQEQAKALSVAGYKLFLQILAIHRPAVCVANLSSYCDLRNTYQNQPPACLSLLWAVGQAGIDHFNIALKIWLELMVPLIGLKNYSAYVVEYGSTCVFGGGGGGGVGDELGVREFFSILDFTWCSSGSLLKPVQRELFALYPKVKTTAFSSKPETNLRTFFPSFLRRLTASASQPLRQELVTCLVQCLTQDTECWSIWGQLYLKHLEQSAQLLQYLNKEWKVLSKSLKIRNREVKEVIEAFNKANQHMLPKARSIPGAKEATKLTTLLLEQMKTPPSKLTWRRFINFLLFLFVFSIALDIKKAGSFDGSRLGQLLQRLGLKTFIYDGTKTLRKLLIQSYRWSATNLPVYYKRGCELAGPYLLLAFDKCTAVSAICFGVFESAAGYIPVIKEMFETRLPGFSNSVVLYSNLAYENFLLQFDNVKEIFSPYLESTQLFLSSNVFIGLISPEKLQGYAIGAMNYTTNMLLRFHYRLVTSLEDNEETRT